MATQLRIGGDGTRLVNLAQRPVSAQRGVSTPYTSIRTLHGRTIDVTIAKAEKLIGAEPRHATGWHRGARYPGCATGAGARSSARYLLRGLFTIDGRPTSVRVTGSTDDALRGRPLSLSGCGPANAATLAPGRHRLVAQLGPENPNGLAVQRLVLASAAGGAAGPASALMTMAPTERGPGGPRAASEPNLDDGARRRVVASLLARPRPERQPRLARQDRRARSRRPRLVNGYANGWLVPSGAAARAVTVGLKREPHAWSGSHSGSRLPAVWVVS